MKPTVIRKGREYVRDAVRMKSNRYGITIYLDGTMPYGELLLAVKKNLKHRHIFLRMRIWQWNLTAALLQKMKSFKW